MQLEPVNFDQVLLRQVIANQEGRHILALVSLQLYDLAKLFIIHHVTVAAELCAKFKALSTKASASGLSTASGRKSSSGSCQELIRRQLLCRRTFLKRLEYLLVVEILF